jgi:uncharacterized protein
MRKISTSSVRIFYPRFDTAWLVRALRARIERLGGVLPLRRVVLFGSYATGRYTVASDVDLLVVYQGEPRPDAYALVKRTLNIPGLEPHLYTEAECEALASTIARMVEAGVEILP